jgi:hypothetical protein
MQESQPSGLTVSQVQQLAQLMAHQQAAQAAPAVASAPQAAPEPAGDSYLDAISPESLEVLGYFGPEAPVKLNTYANAIEDALLESLTAQGEQQKALQEHIEWATRAVGVLQAAELEREGLIRMLTVPDLLAQYTEAFFSEGGPAPVQTPGEQARAALQAGLVTPDGRLMSNDQAYRGMQDPAFLAAVAAAQAEQQASGEQIPLSAFRQQSEGYGQRPTMPMPSPGAYNGGPSPQDVWSTFAEASAVDPTKAWMVLDQAPAEALRAKILAMDS